MIEDRDVLERLTPLFPPPADGLESCLRLGDRRRRNRRIRAIALAAVVTAALVGSLVSSIDRSKERPAQPNPITPSNVSDLRVAWSASTDADPKPQDGVQGLAEADGSLYVVTGAHAEISAFPAACVVNHGGCDPIWTGHLGIQPGSCSPIRCVGAMTVGPAVADGLVFVGSLHRLSAFPVACTDPCRPVWTAIIDVADGIVHQAVVANDVVYAGTGGGHLYAFPVSCEDPCEPLWVSQRQRTSLRVLQVVNGVVYADTDDFWGSATPDAPKYDMGYAFPAACAEGCRPLWTTRLDRVPNAVSLSAVGGIAYVGGSSDRGLTTLAAYRAGCGIEERCRAWATSLPAAAADLIVVDGVLVVTVPGADQVRGYPLVCSEGCDPLWSATIPRVHGRPVGADGLVYLPSASGVTAVPVGCGTGGGTCQPIHVTNRHASGMSVGDDRVFVRSSNGRVSAFVPRPRDETAAAHDGVGVAFPSAVLVVVLVGVAIAYVRSRRRIS